VEPEPVTRYLQKAFGDVLPAVRQAFAALAETLDPGDPPQTLSNRAGELHERFRPEVPRGQAGQGFKGLLDLDRVRAIVGG
jgi:hypothetical protein